MELEKELPDYDSISNALIAVGIPLSASEVHGWLAGLFCTKIIKPDAASAKKWTKDSLELTDPWWGSQALLFEHLYTSTFHNLMDIDFGFELLLPDEDDELEARALELSNWCKGFLSGLEMGDYAQKKTDDESIEEDFQTIQEIATMDYDSIRFSTEDENAYIEAVGYVRLGVLNILMEVEEGGKADSIGYLH